MSHHRTRPVHPLRIVPAGLGLTAALLLLAPSAGAVPAAGAKLVGKWAAVSMAVGGKRYPVKPPLRITFEYRAGGTLVVVMTTGARTKTKQGSWRATATHVDMTVDKETQKMTYVVKGSQLTLRGKKAGRDMSYIMKRIR